MIEPYELEVGERARPRGRRPAACGAHRPHAVCFHVSSLMSRMGRVLYFILLSLCLVRLAGSGYANPQGLTVVSGSAHTAPRGNVLQINTSQNAVLQWRSFNIAAGETTVFHQPSASSIVFNQINNANPTAIFGSLRANGIVVLQNQSGFYFGPNAFVQAGGLVVTTAAINPWSSGGGAAWSFDGPPAATPIVNYGHLQTAAGGSLFLIAKQIENHGTIAAPGGTAALLAGQEVLLSERPDGLSLSVPVHLPSGSVDNQGRIVADAGQVLLQAQTVNNSGVVQANSVREKNGVIELYASDDVQLTDTSVIQAHGGGDGTSPGGSIVIKSGGSYSDAPGSSISMAGGAQGGHGGSVEISAASMSSVNSAVDGRAAAGSSGGKLTLDPYDIEIGNQPGTGDAGSGTVTSGTSPSAPGDILYLNVNSAFTGLSQIDLQATHSITLDAFTTWNLTQLPPQSGSGCQLTLEAGNMLPNANDPGSQIVLNYGSSIVGGPGWSVTLEAGRDFSSSSPRAITPGAGNILLNDNCTIQTADGNIKVVAGNSVTLGSGGIVTGIANGNVMTGGGGNINVQAVAGDVDAGTSAAGYIFADSGYAVDPALGGISTASGGNVTIQAGGNIFSALPETGANASDFGSGAFGAAPGNVTLTAGGDVTGHYVLGNGTGIINCENAGTTGINLALSLIKGEWVVNAADNIVLQEVRNPNGIFNNSGYATANGGGSPVSSRFLYDYDPQASVVLDAGNSATITGAFLPRTPDNALIGLVFPPILTMDAGVGGITLKSAVNLFPSADGTLNLTTTGGGNLFGSSINVSDSASVQGENPRTLHYPRPERRHAAAFGRPEAGADQCQRLGFRLFPVFPEAGRDERDGQFD